MNERFRIEVFLLLNPQEVNPSAVSNVHCPHSISFQASFIYTAQKYTFISEGFALSSCHLPSSHPVFPLSEYTPWNPLRLNYQHLLPKRAKHTPAVVLKPVSATWKWDVGKEIQNITRLRAKNSKAANNCTAVTALSVTPVQLLTDTNIPSTNHTAAAQCN